MLRVVLAVCLVTVMSGCAGVRTGFAPFGNDAAAVDSLLLTTGDVDREYTELGVIFVRGRYSGYEAVMQALRAEAANRGADAVIKIEFKQRYYHAHRPRCQGVAVKYK